MYFRLIESKTPETVWFDDIRIEAAENEVGFRKTDNGFDVREALPGVSITPYVRVKTTSVTPESLKYILALYRVEANRKILVSANIIDGSVSTSAVYSPSLSSISIPDDDSVYMYRAMVWRDIANISPLSESAVLSQSEGGI